VCVDDTKLAVDAAIDAAIDGAAALDTLTEGQRLVLLLSAEGYTQREIAAALGVSQVAIHGRRRRALGKLAKSSPRGLSNDPRNASI